jgi:glycosyltransferase involved in cell wall biosynthesis
MSDRSDLPLVTAIIPTHNRGALLKRAVDSVLAQTYPSIEIIVVDDGSTDDTPRIIDVLAADNPLVYIRHDRPKGAPAARNAGIERASGRYIAGLDDDDEWMPERIEKLVAAIDDEIACVTSDDLLISERRTLRWRKRPIITLDDLLLSNAVGNQVLVEREKLVAVGGFDESLEAAQDYDLWIRLAERFGQIRNVSEPLQRVHVGHAARITTSSAQYRGYLAMYAKHRHLMSRRQRAYQLFSIRRKVGKPVSLRQFFSMVPKERWAKEIRTMIAARIG